MLVDSHTDYLGKGSQEPFQYSHRVPIITVYDLIIGTSCSYILAVDP